MINIDIESKLPSNTRGRRRTRITWLSAVVSAGDVRVSVLRPRPCRPTRGGLSGDTVRVTMPISDRSRRTAARVEALTPFKRVRRSTNRLVPTLVRRLNTETTYRRPSSRASLFAGHRRWRLWDPQACSIWIDLNGLMLNYSSRRKRATRNETLSTTCNSAVYLEARGAAQPQVTPRTPAGRR